jgi:hypothetical protein
MKPEMSKPKIGHDAIYDALRRALKEAGGPQPADMRFQMEVRFFLEETKNFDRALSILVEVGEDLGLVTRDVSGHFEPRKPESVAAKRGGEAKPAANDDIKDDAEAQVEAEAEDEAAIAEALKRADANEPDEAYWQGEAKTRKEVWAKAFEFRLGTGRKIGDMRWSELLSVSSKLGRDAEIARAVYDHAKPAKDDLVRAYMPAKVVHSIIQNADKRRKTKEKREAQND